MKEYFTTKVGDLEVSIFITKGELATSRDVPDDDDEIELDGIFYDGIDVEYLCTKKNCLKILEKYTYNENITTHAELAVMDLGLDSDEILNSAYENYKTESL